MFRSRGDLNYYVGQPVVADAKFYDPAHQTFKDFVGPLVTKITVSWRCTSGASRGVVEIGRAAAAIAQ